MQQQSISKVFPVLFGFFIMGFCDVVGISSNYVKQDFNLSNTMANFLPFMVFIWFFVFSIPTGIMMNRLGRKKTVQVSNIITFIAMIIPFIGYSYYSCLAAFATLGIANTILQVSLNPLLSNVVRKNQLTSALTTGQFVKAISSFSGPFIAAFSVSYFGNWQSMFPLFAGITLLSSIWLQLTPIEEITEKSKTSSFSEVCGLLKDNTLVLLFLGIVFVVGVDVGTNTVTPRILMERCGTSTEEANYGVSIYFACRTIGAFIGAFILSKFSETKFFRIGMVVAVVALIAMIFASDKTVILVLVGVVGFSCANVFSILFSISIQRKPEKANEISGLMITGISGGALIPIIMGLVTDLWGNQSGSIAVILLCGLYLLICSFLLKKSVSKQPHFN